MRATFLAGLMLVVLLVASTWTLAPPAGAADIDQMIATAKTATDHQAIANYYDQQATQARAQIAQHAKMRKAYETSPSLRSAGPGFWRVGAKDCDVLERSYENIAKQDEALAKMHREMVTKLGGSH
ncbi:MAG TPA: hypothetical protein VKT99_04635 [Xanthobacteraceae bacterium]|nr:hypothetical protein [Xanthobacteraceae bacterium]